MKILLVEDNAKIAKYIIKMLEEENYQVEHIQDGFIAEHIIKKNVHDLIILDLMIPGKDGLLICKSIRKENITTPILMLTARSGIEDKLIGFNNGADDYLAKPFNMKELKARVAALLRRPKKIKENILSYRKLSLYKDKHLLYKNNKKIQLTKKEFMLIEYFMENVGISLSREKLMSYCWDMSLELQSNIIDAYIKQLRKKIETKHEKYIKTIRGIGYKFE